jgi:SAM-dependent methyltransferase
MQLVDRDCSVCQRPTEAKVVYEANYDPASLDAFAFSSRKFPEHMHFRLLSCSQCSLLFASPAPDGHALDQAYENAAYDSGPEADAASRTYARYLAKHLPLFSERDGALEVGTGNGSFLSYLRALGFINVQGVEPSLAPIEASEPEVRPMIRHAPFRASDYAKESLALVTCFQTLEHVLDPGRMTREIFELLRPGGGIFFVAHNREAILNRVLGTRSPIYDVEHAQLFSPRSLTALVRQAGFESDRVFAIVNSYPIRYWLRLVPLSRGIKTSLIGALDRANLGQARVAVPVGNIGVVALKGRGHVTGRLARAV